MRLPRYDHQVMEPDEVGSSLEEAPYMSGWGRFGLVCVLSADAVGSRPPLAPVPDLIRDRAFVVGGGSPVLTEDEVRV